MSDLVERLTALCERHAKIPEGPYFVGIDEAADCPPHTNSGLSLVDTGRQSDWPIARLCEGPTAAAIADLPTMLAAIREAAAEIERLRADAGRTKALIGGMVRWLEDNQHDVFTRGIWEAISEAENAARASVKGST